MSLASPSWRLREKSRCSIRGYVRALRRPAAFGLPLLLILVWAVAGPTFRYSDTWQLVANTAANLITFVMVFVIQNSQNRDATAIRAKLDEMIRAGNAANRFAGIDLLSEDEVNALRATCAEPAKKAEQDRAKR